ncbi:chorismate--pyruvate lyase family protein [Gallibacterium melopsittaci]|uniref:Chorismate--pyruvate lyase family protein n=1 Tax=Gallibacterium melopsittaci TaxID=516063 RepID=A0ABV6HV48_9PAST
MPNYQHYRDCLQNIYWQTDFKKLSNPQQQWLSISGSLTAALKQHCKIFTVIPLFEGWITEHHPFYLDELAGYKQYWLREVILAGDNQAWIFARTVIPTNTFQQYRQAFQQLGNQPIGEWLFQQAAVRSDLAWGKIENKYARRSILTVADYPLLVSELFLEDFW